MKFFIQILLCVIIYCCGRYVASQITDFGGMFFVAYLTGVFAVAGCMLVNHLSD